MNNLVLTTLAVMLFAHIGLLKCGVVGSTLKNFEYRSELADSIKDRSAGTNDVCVQISNLGNECDGQYMKVSSSLFVHTDATAQCVLSYMSGIGWNGCTGNLTYIAPNCYKHHRWGYIGDLAAPVTANVDIWGDKGDSSGYVSCVCRTKDDKDSVTGKPPSPNVPCHFPFNWNGKTYNECTNDDHSHKWCGTQVDVVGNSGSLLEFGVTDGWGNCEETQICGHVPGYTQVKKNAECTAPYETLGVFDDLATCVVACSKTSNCEFFIYGKENHYCYSQKTSTRECKEGWEVDNKYDFYEMTVPQSNN